MYKLLIASLGLIWCSSAKAERISQIACVHQEYVETSSASVCESSYRAAEELIQPIESDACRLEELWKNGAHIEHEIFHLSRPVVLTSIKSPTIVDTIFDFSSVNCDAYQALIIFADDSKTNGVMMKDVFVSPIAGTPDGLLAWLPDQPHSECSNLIS